MNTEALYKLLASYSLTLSCEKVLQTEIGDLLTTNGVEHTREVRLSDKDCIDFMVGSVGIEVKLKGSPMDIYRQCERYCGHQEVSELILVTNRSMGFPALLKWKPTYILSLGRSWL